MVYQNWKDRPYLTPTLTTEPLLPQLVTPMTPLATPPASQHSPSTLPPDIWSQMNRRARKHWLQQNKPL